MTQQKESLLLLSRALGDPARDLVILAEGNVSARLSAGTMLIKASGSSMCKATPDDFVEVRIPPILDLLDDQDADDELVARVLLESRMDAKGKMPSIEAILHAICVTEAGSQVVGHTHPTAVNALLCSSRASELAAGSLFPDQIVVMGRHPLMIPYTDPGLELARRVRSDLLAHIDTYGEPPKVIYLINHGMFALGRSASEVLQITEMATKSARILAGALAVGQAVHLESSDSERIDSRPDELLRRRELSQSAQISTKDAR